MKGEKAELLLNVVPKTLDGHVHCPLWSLGCEAPDLTHVNPILIETLNF